MTQDSLQDRFHKYHSIKTCLNITMSSRVGRSGLVLPFLSITLVSATKVLVAAYMHAMIKLSQCRMGL